MSADHASIACAAAIDYIRHIIEDAKRPVVFGEDQRFKPGVPSRWHSQDASDGQPIPSSALAAKFERESPPNLLNSCKVVRTFLTDGHISYGRGAVKRAMTEGSDGLWRADVYDIALPIISDDGAEALIAVNDASGVRMGRGRVVYLRRNEVGSWIIAGSGGIWMS